MSASDEIDEMHLSPEGWAQGSRKIAFAGWTRRDPPAGLVLTVSSREYVSSSYSPMGLSADVTGHAPDSEILTAPAKHSAEPCPGSDRYRGWPEFLKQIGHSTKG